MNAQTFLDIEPAHLDAMNGHDVDQLPYGVVGLSGDGIVEVYNAAEARLAGSRRRKRRWHPLFRRCRPVHEQLYGGPALRGRGRTRRRDRLRPHAADETDAGCVSDS